ERFDMPPPVFRLRTTKGEIHEPLTSATNAASLDLSLVVFRNVPVGSAVLTSSGHDWESTESFVFVSEPVTALEDIALAPAGDLRIELGGVGNDVRLPSPKIAISRCQDLTSQPRPCTDRAERELAG